MFREGLRAAVLVGALPMSLLAGCGGGSDGGGGDTPAPPALSAKALAGKIAKAQVSARLTDSPAVLIAGEFGLSLRMGRILKQAGQTNPFATLPILELNPKHPLVERLKDTADGEAFADLAHVLYDQAMLAEGGELDDPASFVRRINKLIVEGLAAQPKIILS